MKTKILIISTLTFIASITSAAIEEHYEEKPIFIQKAGAFESEKQVKIRTGKDVTFKIKIYEDEFFGQTTISANATIDNATAKKVKAVYAISFHDKDGKLIGCHQGSWDLDPNDDVNYGSGIIFTEPELIKEVTSYKLRTFVVESTD